MEATISTTGSSDPYTSVTVCFLCSNSQVSLNFSNVYLTVNGLQSSDDDKLKLLNVVCQLLRVEWDVVQNLFSQNVYFPFCESCLNSVINMIHLRDQLFRIESDVRDKIRQMELSIAKSYKAQKTVDQLEWKERNPKDNHSAYRQSFQKAAMEEYWNKELLREKIKELNCIQNDFMEIDLSLIQLQLEKNVFQITRTDNERLTTENLDGVTATMDDIIQVPHEFLDITRMCETPIEYTCNQELEFSFNLDPTNVVGDLEDDNLVNNRGSECSMPTLRINGGEGIHQSGYLVDDDEPDRKSQRHDDKVVDSDPDYQLPSKKSKRGQAPETVPGCLISVPPTSECVQLPSQTLTVNVSEHCACRSNKNLQLVCKICRKQARFQPNKYQSIRKTVAANKCPLCSAKFANIKLLKEHLRKVHFPPTPVKFKKKARKDSRESGMEVDKNGEPDAEVKRHKTELKKTGLYDPDEIIESLSEEDNDPIMEEISSDTSNSEEEKKSETTKKPRPTIRCRKATRSKSGSQKNKFATPATGPEICVNSQNNPVVTEYIAKDKTIWTTLEPPKNQIKNSTTLPEDGKLLGSAANQNLTPVKIFKLMVSPDIVDTIVKYTNMCVNQHTPSDKIKQKKQTSKNRLNEPFWKPFSPEEIYGYIGIILYLGLEKKSKTSTDEAWSSNAKYRIACVAATMSRVRFRDITRYLRFDDQVARRRAIAQGLQPERLSYVSEIFNPFVANIGSYLQPYETLVVDEMLIKFRGTSKFRVYMKSKPGKYGIKIWACCDTKTGYILRLIIYEGKQGDKVETQLGRKVVLKLVKKYFGTRRCVTTDNFFTSKALAHDLMEQNITLLGTLNKCRMDVIPEFAEGKRRDVESSIFAFQDDLTMVSYIPRKNRSVVLLSTQHHTIETIPAKRNKPRMILDYNKTKGAVDTADQMIASSSCQRTTHRWPMKIFFAMCDIGALNAYYIWRIHQKNLNQRFTRRDFLRQLSETLMKPLIKARAEIGWKLPVNTRLAIELMGYQSAMAPVIVKDQTKVFHGRCNFCKGRSRKSSNKTCTGCKKWICKSHSAIIPPYCLDCNPLAAKDVNKGKHIRKRVEEMEDYEDMFFPSIINPTKGIFTTPLKDSEQNELPHCSQVLNPKKPPVIRSSPVKKAQSIPVIVSKSTTKLRPRQLFNEMDTQEILHKTPNIIDPKKDIFKTPVKNSAQKEHSFCPQLLNLKKPCAPVKKPQPITVNVPKTKFRPINLFNEIDTQEILPKTDSLRILQPPIEPAGFQSKNYYYPMGNSSSIFIEELDRSHETFI